MTPVNKQAEKISANHAYKVNKQKPERPQERFQSFGKKIQRDHIEQQMHPAYVQKTRCDQHLIIFLQQHFVYAKCISFIEGMILKAFVRNKKGNSYNRQGNKSGRVHT